MKDAQLNNYKAAVGKRNVASKATSHETTLAKNTAIGDTRRRGKPGGSFEGYMHAAPAHIQMKNTGYDAKSAQKARNSRSNIIMDHLPRGNPISRPVYSKNVFDYRYCGSAGNSVERLKNLTKLNRLF